MNIISMSDAKEQGLTRYFTGEPCPYGHVAERIVSTRACYECCRNRKHRWSAENPEKVNAQKRNYVKANLEKVKQWKSANQKKHRAKANERTSRWYYLHRERILEKRSVWAKNNPDKEAAKSARYRANKLKQTPPWANHKEIEKVYALAARFRSLGCDFHVDHIIPLQGKLVCGLHVHNNLRIIEAEANRSKSNKY